MHQRQGCADCAGGDLHRSATRNPVDACHGLSPSALCVSFTYIVN
jgi:hypothetical protein